tara:strand:- start:3050 stop:4849 length:1800 start_codon:yes stop_codon:yes gene_type:complete
MTTKIQVRRDTTGNWTTHASKVPASGEFCYDTDLKTLKIGDGTTTYGNLNVIADSNDTYHDTDARYVRVAGANMTGDLTLGTDKITLDAGNGSSEFKGNLSIKNSSSIQVKATGDDSTSKISLTSDGRGWFGGGAFLGGNSVGSSNTSLNSDGTSSFGSTLTVGGAALNGAAAGAQLYPTGGIHATQASGSSTILSGYVQGSSTKNVAISADGTAEFKGLITSNRFSNVFSMISANVGGTQYGFAVTDASSNLKAGITATGAGTFASGYSGISASGDVYATRSGGSSDVWNSGINGSASSINMKANGEATFGGTVISGSDPNSGAGRGTSFNQYGTLRAANTSGTVFEGYTVGTENSTSSINTDGSAEFSGPIQASATSGSYIFNLDDGGVNQGGFYQSGVGTSLYLKAKATGTSVSNVTLNGHDGTAVFAGTVSAQGSVLTSDQRFKENITDANPQLADVTALGNSLRNWDWSSDAPVADKDTRFLGLIAQEVEVICPGIVKTIARTKQGAELTPEVVVPAVYETRTVPAVLDDEGEVVEAETTEQVLVTEEQVTPATYEELDDSYKGISHDALIMKLLGAVAELTARVEELENNGGD